MRSERREEKSGLLGKMQLDRPLLKIWNSAQGCLAQDRMNLNGSLALILFAYYDSLAFNWLCLMNFCLILKSIVELLIVRIGFERAAHSPSNFYGPEASHSVTSNCNISLENPLKVYICK